MKSEELMMSPSADMIATALAGMLVAKHCQFVGAKGGELCSVEVLAGVLQVFARNLSDEALDMMRKRRQMQRKGGC